MTNIDKGRKAKGTLEKKIRIKRNKEETMHREEAERGKNTITKNEKTE